MKTLNVLIKPASSLCNLRCRYCFYNDIAEKRPISSFGIMQKEVVDDLILKIAKELDFNGEANIAFQGGEPTVASLEWFEYFVMQMQKYPSIIPYYSLQTNATLLDEKWATFFKKHHFLIGVSLDGFQENNDLFRYDEKGNSIYHRALKGVEYLRKYEVDFNVLVVITKQLAKEPQKLFDWAYHNQFFYLQLIPCLPNLNEKENELSLSPQAYANFFKTFFHIWKDNALSGRFISINLFDNLAEILKGMPPYQCGMLGRCAAQYVVEANGDTYPCDFYCLDEYKLGNIQKDDFNALENTKIFKDFMNEPHHKNELCLKCPYLQICNGGCKRQNVCYLENDYCAYQDFLDEMLPLFQTLLN